MRRRETQPRKLMWRVGTRCWATFSADMQSNNLKPLFIHWNPGDKTLWIPSPSCFASASQTPLHPCSNKAQAFRLKHRDSLTFKASLKRSTLLLTFITHQWKGLVKICIVTLFVSYKTDSFSYTLWDRLYGISEGHWENIVCFPLSLFTRSVPSQRLCHRLGSDDEDEPKRNLDKRQLK